MAQMSTAGKVAIAGGAAVIVYLIARAAKAKEGAGAGQIPAGPVVPPPPPPSPSETQGKPSGSPAPYGNACYPENMGGQNMYDTAYWEAGGLASARERIFDAFTVLGYQTPSDRDTMNQLGPDAALGGGDDVPNEEVRRFQRQYNRVSRGGQFVSGTQMGGLWEDGLVGPCTLNGLKLVLDNIGDREWSDIVGAS